MFSPAISHSPVMSVNSDAGFLDPMNYYTSPDRSTLMNATMF